MNHKHAYRKCFIVICLIASSLSISIRTNAWGFYAHRRINYGALFLLPPELLRFYKPQAAYLSTHAVDPDMRRYMLTGEGARHYIDLDLYPTLPPKNWKAALELYGMDSLQAKGIVPWWIQTMQYRLTEAFREKDRTRILKLSAEIGHYIGDAHVPLHACSNHNGQYTNQRGIHGFWESRIPEQLAETEWDFILGKATFLTNPGNFIWERVLESAALADTVLRTEKSLAASFPEDLRYSFELRNGKLVRQYSSAYTVAYDRKLGGMVERRMRASIYAVASFWYTAWVDAGQPVLDPLGTDPMDEQEKIEWAKMEMLWRRDEREH